MEEAICIVLWSRVGVSACLKSMLRLLKTAGAVIRQTGISPGLILQFSCLAIKDDSTNCRLCWSKDTCIMTGLARSNEWPGFSSMWIQIELVDFLSLISLE